MSLSLQATSSGDVADVDAPPTKRVRRTHNGNIAQQVVEDHASVMHHIGFLGSVCPVMYLSVSWLCSQLSPYLGARWASSLGNDHLVLSGPGMITVMDVARRSSDPGLQQFAQLVGSLVWHMHASQYELKGGARLLFYHGSIMHHCMHAHVLSYSGVHAKWMGAWLYPMPGRLEVHFRLSATAEDSTVNFRLRTSSATEPGAFMLADMHVPACTAWVADTVGNGQTPAHGLTAYDWTTLKHGVEGYHGSTLVMTFERTNKPLLFYSSAKPTLHELLQEKGLAVLRQLGDWRTGLDLLIHSLGGGVLQGPAGFLDGALASKFMQSQPPDALALSDYEAAMRAGADAQAVAGHYAEMSTRSRIQSAGQAADATAMVAAVAQSKVHAQTPVYINGPAAVLTWVDNDWHQLAAKFPAGLCAILSDAERLASLRLHDCSSWIELSLVDASTLLSVDDNLYRFVVSALDWEPEHATPHHRELINTARNIALELLRLPL